MTWGQMSGGQKAFYVLCHLALFAMVLHLFLGCAATQRPQKPTDEAIQGVCVPLYRHALTPEDLQKADETCLSAFAAYGRTMAAWKNLDRVLLDPKSTRHDVDEAIHKFNSSFDEMQKLVGELPTQKGPDASH